ncbi:MAG: hypothetical protein ACC707_11685 [Thiohalomonadales bacterium]
MMYRITHRAYLMAAQLRIGLFLLITIVLLVSCDTRKDYSVDIAAIYAVLQVRQQAVANSDLDLYDSILFSDYSDAGIRRDLVLEDIKITFDRFPVLTLQQPRIRPDVKRNSARILQSSMYQSASGKKSVQLREVLMFRKSAGKWYLSGGIALGVASKMK